jgi:hypothetical protein
MNSPEAEKSIVLEYNSLVQILEEARIGEEKKQKILEAISKGLISSANMRRDIRE